MGLYAGGLIFGMVRVLVNWWAYTWGAYIRGGAYIRRFTVYNTVYRFYAKSGDDKYGKLWLRLWYFLIKHLCLYNKYEYNTFISIYLFIYSSMRGSIHIK